jgi:hypothetical protein
VLGALSSRYALIQPQQPSASPQATIISSPIPTGRSTSSPTRRARRVAARLQAQAPDWPRTPRQVVPRREVAARVLGLERATNVGAVVVLGDAGERNQRVRSEKDQHQRSNPFAAAPSGDQSSLGLPPDGAARWAARDLALDWCGRPDKSLIQDRLRGLAKDRAKSGQSGAGYHYRQLYTKGRRT